MSPHHFQAFKISLVKLTSLSKDALHIYVGMALFLITRWLLRKSRHQWIAWVVVLAAAVGGEVLDIWGDVAKGLHPRWDASLHDLVNTTFWPTVIALMLKWTSIFSKRPDPLADATHSDA